MSKFGLRLTESASELATYLNGGELIPVDEESYLIFSIKDDVVDCEAILDEDALYDKNGHLKDSDLQLI